MPKFRIDKIGDLCRQMSFTPQDARLSQLASAEQLLLEIEPAKAYPFNFIIYRITGYHPRQIDQTLLTGMALQHDLGLLIEQASETLNLSEAEAPEPVMSIDDVTQRFNVTSKTIQRWRRRGLAARRFLFKDGKRRVGFLLGTVERFLAIHRDQIIRAGNFSQATEPEKIEILRRARRLANHCHCCVNEISRRIGRRLNRSPLTIAHIIRDHDRANPRSAIFPAAPAELSENDRAEILRAYRHGSAIACLARRMCRTKSAIYRVIVEERLAQLGRRKVRFIDDPLYHQEDAAAVIDQIVSQEELPRDPKGEETRVPRDLPPYLQDLYRTPLLSPPRERALFLKLNFHKFEFVSARRKIEPQFAQARDLNALESLRRRIADVKNQIVLANLRLVVSVARKHLRPGLSLMELISEGNLTLIRAVDSFDSHKGNRFSTYATFALMKGFARSVPQMLAGGHDAVHSEGVLDSLPDRRQLRVASGVSDRDEVRQLLSGLEPRERDVIAAHYGLSEGRPATYEQVGSRMGLSKQRVRQIEQAALAKLRSSHSPAA
ncbi:MAG TPA: sigma-70 family RNA polymerase sigma factor [Tepidisphaeraceae bacterium]|nr:sigma-70 family RNA polymerase sigma factor [Tepidisphaeraceae bacterium]